MQSFVNSARKLFMLSSKDDQANEKAHAAHESYSSNLEEFGRLRSDAVRLRDAAKISLQAAIARQSPANEQRALTKQINDHERKIKEYDSRIKKVKALRDQLDTSRLNTEQVQAMKMANEAEKLMMEAHDMDEQSILDVLDECEDVRDRTQDVTRQLTADFLASDDEDPESEDDDWEEKARLAAGLPALVQHDKTPSMPDAPSNNTAENPKDIGNTSPVVVRL